MSRVNVFAIRVSKEERKTIANLARHLHRSQSDAVRFVLMEAARQLFETTPQPATETSQGRDASQAEREINVPANR